MDFIHLSNLGFLAFLTPVVLFWQQSRNFLLKFFRLFWKSRSIPADFSVVFYRKLYEKSFVINFGDYNIFPWTMYSIEDKKYLTVIFKLFNFELFLYKYYIPIFLFGDDSESLKIQYLNLSFDFNKIFTETLLECKTKFCRDNIEKPLNRFYIEEKRGISLKTLSKSQVSPGLYQVAQGNEVPRSSNKYVLNTSGVILNQLKDRIFLFELDKIQFNSPSGGVQNKYIFTKSGLYILDQVKKWLNAENWYQERNINWRRGILLNGNPGTGKSTLILEIAKKLDIPLITFDLSTFDNDEFTNIINTLTTYSAIILFEDIDSVFCGRDNITKTQNHGGLTFDCFINKISGVNSIKNKFIFITTNHLDKVDAAITRAGRIDEIVELESLNKEEKKKLAEIVLSKDINLIDKTVEDGINDSTAEFENRCVQLALNNFWK